MRPNYMHVLTLSLLWIQRWFGALEVGLTECSVCSSAKSDSTIDAMRYIIFPSGNRRSMHVSSICNVAFA